MLCLIKLNGKWRKIMENDYFTRFCNEVSEPITVMPSIVGINGVILFSNEDKENIKKARSREK